MPDASAGIFSGLYWVWRGKTPMDDLEDDDAGEPGHPGFQNGACLNHPEGCGLAGSGQQPQQQGGPWSGGKGFGR